MNSGARLVPDDPLDFIRQCMTEARIFWTYHVNMRMERRSISRLMILESVSSFEIIEAYPEDKYLPSYLIWAELPETVIHILVAVDVGERNIRIVTAYKPNPDEWDLDLRKRK